MRDEDGEPAAGGEATLAYPDHVETVDALGARARAERDLLRAEAAADAAGADAPAALAEGPGVKIGRYQLLELVGTGGMGMVWGAWDPELERRVALKLVRVASRASRERMLREGQVLARLSHPNVIPIFDVGEVGDQVYLVMEWVRGTTLRAFAAEAPGLRALLEAYHQAGAGLAAAHRAGVIHRDFKPDNAIRGDDGRVRVLDFGLAGSGEASATAAPIVVGTPRYMAPEQGRGEPLTAACDQYAFAVSLREALERAGPVPRWLAALAERGAAIAPEARFSSMAELLDALDRDPARRRRRAALGLAALAAAGGAFAVGRSAAPDAPPAPEVCTAAAEELAASWSPDVRGRAAAHLRTLGAPVTPAQIGELTSRLDGYAAAWIAEHRDACLAHARGALTPQLHEARFACLLRARSQLGGVGELLVQAATADDLAKAQRSAGDLPDVRGCRLAEPSAPPPPERAAEVAAIAQRAERALVRVTAGYTDALPAAAAAARDARGTGYAPLLARALLVQGRAAITAGDPAARGLLGDAWRHALRAFDEPLAVEAYARWAYTTVRFRSAPPPQVAAGEATSLEMWPLMSELAERLGPRGRFSRALLYNNIALPRMLTDAPAARELFERARRAAGDTPEIELVGIHENLARLDPDPEACERGLRAALARREAALGASHPDTLIARRNHATLLRPRRAALAAVTASCAELRAWRQDGEVAVCAYEAGWLADDLGDEAAARAWMAQAAASSGRKGQIAAAHGAIGVDRALRLVELARFAAGAQANALERMHAADALVALARAAERDLAPAAEIDRAWERVLAMLEAIHFSHVHPRKARAQRVLAERWARSRPADASALAARAAAWYRAQPGEEAVVARLTEIAAGAATAAEEALAAPAGPSTPTGSH